MNHREESFKRKFDNAAQHLGVRPDQVVSVKLRENVSSYQEYRDLLENLKRETGVQYSELAADLQGRGYLLTDGKNKVIVVEHETGLEVLYIAGSIASLIGLVLQVLQSWRALRGRMWGRAHRSEPGEIRRMDKAGRLQEEQVHDWPMDMFTPALTATAGLIESEMRDLAQRVQSLTSRVDVLEKHLSSAVGKTKEKTAKSPSTRTGKQTSQRKR